LLANVLYFFADRIAHFLPASGGPQNSYPNADTEASGEDCNVAQGMILFARNHGFPALSKIRDSIRHLI
jgi:hypothetical protein